jgi:hypothetical protein
MILKITSFLKEHKSDFENYISHLKHVKLTSVKSSATLIYGLWTRKYLRYDSFYVKKCHINRHLTTHV